MSAESRLKKLRGSGGYIMATITEEQQRKGNLGGPDLFLAPIGRIDSPKISKHYCNSCEKDYDGGPQIKYETPNEEVAENLILVEKGKYLCNVCGSTIAEYREFRKPDQTSEVGKAKPISEEHFSKPPPAQPTTSIKTETVPSSVKTEIVQPPIQPKNRTVQPQNRVVQQQSDTQVDSSKGSNFSTIIGMDVYDESLKKIGTVREMGVDSTQSVVIVVTKYDGTEESISWSRIKKIGEIILLGSKNESFVEQHSGKSDLKCPNCGLTNREGSKFCENCGTRI
ncbi:MAG: zinc-ribbon domain-containing protein [Nitrososphaerota archaeon]